jgi:metalloendopeptidase OMA1, mitochondrial
MMMAQGCYRPEAAMEFWARMESFGQRSPPQILSTHPSHHNREAKIRELLPEAHDKAASSDCHAMSDYGMCTIPAGFNPLTYLTGTGGARQVGGK